MASICTFKHLNLYINILESKFLSEFGSSLEHKFNSEFVRHSWKLSLNSNPREDMNSHLGFFKRPLLNYSWHQK